MKYIKIVIIMLTGLFFLSGCVPPGFGNHGPRPVAKQKPHKKKYQKQGPPPHAPAHGYRYKHRNGRQLEYDARKGAYVVLQMPETYFNNNLYIRLSKTGKWMVSKILEGGWRIAAGYEVPSLLREYKWKKKKVNKGKKAKGHKKNKYDNQYYE